MAGKIFEIAFNIAGKMNASFNNTFRTTSERMTALNTNTSRLQVQMKELDRQQRKGLLTTQQHADAYSKLAKQLEHAERAQRNMASAMRLQKNADRLATGGRNLALGSAAMGVAAFAGPAVVGINFETSMAQVAKQVDGARDDAGKFTNIGQQAKTDIMTLSKELMKHPVEIANAYALAARSGVKGAENLKEMTSFGVMLGTAFEMPSEQVTTDMAKIGNALGYNLETQEGIAQVQALADKLNYLDDQTLATGEELIGFMKDTAGVAQGIIPTITEGMLGGLGAALLSAGEKSSVAATAINAMFTKFAAAENQSKGFQESLGTLGLTSRQVAEGMATDADSTFKDIFERTRSLDTVTRNRVLAELIGQEHIDTVSKITGNYDKFIDAIKLANSEAAKGSVRKEFKVMSKTTARQLEGLSASTARNGIAIQDNMNPALQSVIDNLNGVSEGIEAFSKNYPKLTSTLVLGTGGILATGVAIGSIGWALGTIMKPLGKAKELFGGGAKGVKLIPEVAAESGGIMSKLLPAAKNIGGKLLLPVGLTMEAIHIAESKDKGKALGEAVGGWAGAWAGAKFGATAGAALGSVVPGLGTAVGTALGSALGAVAGYLAGSEIYNTIMEWYQKATGNMSAAVKNFGIQGNEDLNISDLPMVPGHATGGIFNREHLAWFAEGNKPEAVIPLDGSNNALSLWAQAGQLLGVDQGPSGGGISNVLSSFVQQSRPGNTTVAPQFNTTINIYGNTEPGRVEQEMNNANRSFAEQLQQFLHQEHRVSFG